MRYIKGLIKKKIKNWTGKKWYHQRFDGSPYFLHFIAEAEIITHKDRKLGGDFVVHYCFFDEDKADWYIEMEDIKKVYTAVIKAGKKKNNLSHDFIKKWMPDQNAFYKKCIEIGKTDLGKLSDKELIKLHDEFLEIGLNKNSSSSLIDGFALGTDELIAEKIKQVYEKNTIKDEMRFSEVFSTLTAPLHLSFINKAEIELLKIALKKKDRKKLLKEHQKKFFWIRNNYVDDNVLDVKYFEKELRNVLSMKKDIGKIIRDIEKTPNVNKNKKQVLIKKLQLSKELKYLITVYEEFTYWQDEQKE